MRDRDVIKCSFCGAYAERAKGGTTRCQEYDDGATLVTWLSCDFCTAGIAAFEKLLGRTGEPLELHELSKGLGYENSHKMPDERKSVDLIAREALDRLESKAKLEERQAQRQRLGVIDGGRL